MNCFKAPDDRPPEVRRVDARDVREQQVAKLARLRAGRDEAKLGRALNALREGASGTGNLLALSIQAARAQATVGEISLALEDVFGRHAAKAEVVTGVYARTTGETDAVTRTRALVAAFAENDGRRPRILVAKIGQDGHDRGQKVIASAFGDLGFDVAVGPLFATPEEAVRQAVDADVHVIGLSTLAAGHLTLVPALKQALRGAGRDDIMIVVGGIIPSQDFAALTAAGAAAIFPPGTVITEAAETLLDALSARLGYQQKAAE